MRPVAIPREPGGCPGSPGRAHLRLGGEDNRFALWKPIAIFTKFDYLLGRVSPRRARLRLGGEDNRFALWKPIAVFTKC